MLEQHGIEAYVKYNLFHKEQHRAYRNDPFRVENMYYNRDEDYYVCPMGQHMVMVGTSSRISDTGYRSYTKTYRAKDCSRCPLRGQCYKGKASRKEIEVNHHLNEYKARARELLMSEEGLRHRSRRPIEPESVFGQIKYDWHYRRFRHRGKGKVYMEQGRIQGHMEGHKEGHKEGLEEGIVQGKEQGKAEEKVKTAKKLKAAGVDMAIIAECTGLDIAAIVAL